MNQFISGVLSSAVGWQREESQAASKETGNLRSRRIATLLAVNLVLVGLAAIAAIAFLVAAWLS